MSGFMRVAALAVAALSLGACQVIPQSAEPPQTALPVPCLLYTSDAADE